MEYMEAINFVRYGEGQHFSVHTDDGFSYSCTLSSVGYLNDDYEGGEIWFPNLKLKFRPQKGDILFFPSTYIYAHAALEVTSGIKYSAVTMFDYNDNNHKDIKEEKKENDGSATLRRING
jgi:predicted 2-oxoglutarate/Fe(II)-dependent dioxygenase YbiX